MNSLKMRLQWTNFLKITLCIQAILNICCNFVFMNFIADYQIGQSDLSLPLYRSWISLKLTELWAFQKCHLKKNTLYLQHRFDLGNIIIFFRAKGSALFISFSKKDRHKQNLFCTNEIQILIWYQCHIPNATVHITLIVTISFNSLNIYKYIEI